MSQFMKAVAVTVLILMVIGSFVAGGTFVFAGLLTSAITFGILYSIGEVLEKIDILSEQLQGLKETGDSCMALLKDLQKRHAAVADEAPSGAQAIPKLAQTTPEQIAPEQTTPDPAQPAVNAADVNGHPTFVVDRSGSTIFCPNCGLEQKSNRSVCFKCSTRFISKEDAAAQQA